MIHWINHNKISIFAAFVGAFIGFAYWHFIGCENGCTIKSVWWKMVGIGGLFGWVIGSWIKESILRYKENKNEKNSFNT